MKSAKPQEQKFPSVIFKVKDNIYSVNSQYIDALLPLPEATELPEAPATIKGIFSYRDGIATLFDLRTAFGQIQLADEFSDFCNMLEQRKQEHIEWVYALEQSIETGEPFVLSHDPHACNFGKWFDHFKSSNHSINLHLHKIDQPHQQLHHSADEVDDCMHITDPVEQQTRLQEILHRVKDELMPKIVALLDETMEIFRNTIFHEMVLVLRQAQLGLIVDEVLMVDDLLPAEYKTDGLSSVHKSPYVLGIRKSEKIEQVIMELNIPYLLQEHMGAAYVAE